jgi:hypothetical protein
MPRPAPRVAPATRATVLSSRCIVRRIVRSPAMGGSVRAADDLEAGLRAIGTPERAAHEQRYLKSDLEHLGATVWQIRREVKSFAEQHPALSHAELVPARRRALGEAGARVADGGWCWRRIPSSLSQATCRSSSGWSESRPSSTTELLLSPTDPATVLSCIRAPCSTRRLAMTGVIRRTNRAVWTLVYRAGR